MVIVEPAQEHVVGDVEGASDARVDRDIFKCHLGRGGLSQPDRPGGWVRQNLCSLIRTIQIALRPFPRSLTANGADKGLYTAADALSSLGPKWTVVMPLEICLPSHSADINKLTGLPGHFRLRVK
jgi:hypothetical protein